MHSTVRFGSHRWRLAECSAGGDLRSRSAPLADLARPNAATHRAQMQSQPANPSAAAQPAEIWPPSAGQRRPMRANCHSRSHSYSHTFSHTFSASGAVRQRSGPPAERSANGAVRQRSGPPAERSASGASLADCRSTGELVFSLMFCVSDFRGSGAT